MPPVYVVILAYNDRTYLPQFLSTVLHTHYNPLTVWVIDNGSTPPLAPLLQDKYAEYLQKGQLRLLRYEENTGYAGGYQRFFEAHGGEVPYLALLNSDVEVSAHWLSPLIERLERDPTLAAIQPKILSYTHRTYFEYAGGAGGLLDPWGYPTCRGRKGFSMEPDQGQYDEVIPLFWASGAAFVVRTDAVRQALKGRLFKNRYFMHMEEIDLCWRFQRAGYTIGYEPHSIVYHVGGGSLPQSSPIKTYYNFRNNLFLLSENLHKSDKWLIPWRLVLDGLAGLYFLLTGRPQHTWAIVRAHGAFHWDWLRGKLEREAFLPFLRLKKLKGISAKPWLLDLLKR